jgi:hypothetical protein
VDKLWIANVPPGTTDEEIVELAKKYSGLDGAVIEHVPGDGSRPAVVMQFAGAPLGAVNQLALRLQGLYWKDRALHAATVQH